MIGHGLLHIAYAQTGFLVSLAEVQRQTTGQHRQKRRFAHAVAAHNAEPVALLHEYFGMIQKLSVAERQPGILNGKKSQKMVQKPVSVKHYLP